MLLGAQLKFAKPLVRLALGASRHESLSGNRAMWSCWLKQKVREKEYAGLALLLKGNRSQWDKCHGDVSAAQLLYQPRDVCIH